MNKHSFTLIELVIVLVGIAILAAVGIIGLKTLHISADNCSEVVISNLLNSARTIAAAEQRYAGVRFQRQDDVQYAVFIIHNRDIPYPDDNKTIPFTALKNHPPFNLGQKNFINNKTTITFSPQGKLVRKWVKVFSNPDLSKDDIFGEYGLLPQDETSELSDNSITIENHDSQKFFINSYTGTLIKPK